MCCLGGHYFIQLGLVGGEGREIEYIRSIQMSSNMDMLSTSSIMTWVIASELRYSLTVSRLNPTLESGVDVFCTAVVSVSNHTTVNTSSICLPELNYFLVSYFPLTLYLRPSHTINVRYRLASGGIKNQDIEDEINTLLNRCLTNILSHIFPRNIVWSLSSLWDENTRLVSGEEDIQWCIWAVIDGGKMTGVENLVAVSFFDGTQIAGSDEVRCCVP